MRSLLETGADVNERDESNSTPLWGASDGGRLEVAKLLIEYGADVNLPEWTGWTPLHVASRGGYADIVQPLLVHGADVDAKNQDQWTALHFALDRYFTSTEIVKALLDQGANVHVQNSRGETPFQRASRRGEREIMRLFSECGAHGK
jgi:ankyrin repeat protein